MLVNCYWEIKDKFHRLFHVLLVCVLSFSYVKFSYLVELHTIYLMLPTQAQFRCCNCNYLFNLYLNSDFNICFVFIYVCWSSYR